MTHRSWRRFAVCVSSVWLAACAGLPPHLFQGGEARAVTALLAQFDGLALLPAEEQKRELAAAQAAFEADSNDINRLRLALALSVPQPPLRDDTRLIALVGDWPAGGGEPSLSREVAKLLHRQATDRQKLLREDQRRIDGLREEQRRSETQLRDEQRRADAQFREEHKRFEELQQKLDALRAIDREARRVGRH
jgi:hypothetical protein